MSTTTQRGGRQAGVLDAVVVGAGLSGLRRYPTFFWGEGVFLWNGTAHRAGVEHDFAASLLFFRPAELGLPAAERDQALALQARFRALVEQVPPPAPWDTPGADTLDRTSVAQWLERQGAGELAGYPLAWLTRMGGYGGFEPYESSILHLAWTQAVAPQHETPEAWLVEGGVAQLAERLGAELRRRHRDRSGDSGCGYPAAAAPGDSL